MASSATKIVQNAIEHSLDLPSFKSTFRLRNPGPENEGSAFFSPASPQDLMEASWEEYKHAAIMPPAVGFSANIPGIMGIVSLKKLPPETPCEMRQEHKGEFPFVSPVVARRHVREEIRTVDFTVILLRPCPHPEHSDRIVLTFHPGPPVSPSTMKPSTQTEAVRTVYDAIQLGFLFAKIVATE